MNSEHPLSPLKALRRALGALACKTPLYDMTMRNNVPAELSFIPPDPWPGNPRTGRAIIGGHILAAGTLFAVSDTKSLWHADEKTPDPQLALLHGFSFLHDLRAAGGDDARIMARSLVSSWIDAHGSWHGHTWRPDILARRICAWMSLHDFYCASAEDSFRAQVFLSLNQQLRHLARTAADCPAGIGMLSVIKALCYGGLCFPSEDARIVQALRLLEGEIRLQILADGGHISRSPEQLLTALIDLIDIRTALRAARRPVPDSLTHAIERIPAALRLFRHGDGALALFNGANESSPPLIDMAIAQADAKPRALRSATTSHFERLSLGKTLIIADTGAPPRIPAAKDAHAGTSSFEMSVGKQRIITNCGSTNIPGEWPLVLRGTAAHSTLIMADINSSSIMPGSRKPASTQVRREDGADNILLSITHDGYKRPLGTLHTRRITLGDLGETVSGEDILEGPSGQPFTIRFHLFPDIIASTLTGGDILLRTPSGMGWRFHVEGATPALEDSVYFGHPDSPRKTRQITLSGNTGHKQTHVCWRLAHETRKNRTEASE